MFFLNWVLLRLNFVPYFLRLPRPCPLVGKRICLASLTVCPLLIILSVYLGALTSPQMDFEGLSRVSRGIGGCTERA